MSKRLSVPALAESAEYSLLCRALKTVSISVKKKSWIFILFYFILLLAKGMCPVLSGLRKGICDVNLCVPSNHQGA